MKNKFGEERMCQVIEEGGPYYISRDLEGNHILRLGDPDGKELFATETDAGKKNKEKQRVRNAALLYDVIDTMKEKALRKKG